MSSLYGKYLAVFSDSSPWLYDPLFPMDSESFLQMQQQRTIYNSNYPWYGVDFDIDNLKAMQELPLQQPSVWEESDGASPNSQHYVLSDSRDSSPCVSANAPSESGTQRLNMGENFSGFRDEFKALPLLEQQKILSSEVDLPRKVELHKIFIDNMSRIKAQVFEDPDTGEASADLSKIENQKPIDHSKADQEGPRSSNEKEQTGEQEADAAKKSSRRGVVPSDEMPFSCTRCGVGCRDKTSLRKHMYVHQPRRYFCEFTGCNIGFHTKRDLRRHTDTKHRKLATGVVGARVRRKSFICTINACERGRAKPFSRRDNARQHVVGVHGIKNTRGEAEQVIEEIDIDIDGDGAVEPVEESSAQRAEPKKPSETPTKPSLTERAPISGHKTGKSKESEDVFAEFTNLQEARQDNSVTKPNSTSQIVQTPRKKPSASEPGDTRPSADSGLPSAPPKSDEQSKLLQQQQLMASMSASFLALSQPDTPQADLDRAMDIWEQMEKAQKNGTAPPIDPSSIFDIEMLVANMHL
ncbi:hypothetical protein TWF281_002409 [Arthrobotrys megalospora]